MRISKWIERNTYSLSGKTVAITGTTGGLGRELCVYLLKLGASIILMDRSRERSEAFKKSLEERFDNASVELIGVDLSNMDSVKEATKKLKLKKPDVFIHNAGAYSIPREICKTGFDNVFQINFASPYYIIKELMPHLREVKGRVIAVGSIAHNYSRSDEKDIDFKTRKKASRVYGNAKRYLMFALHELFKDEEDVKLSVTHPGISFTNITAHYPKLIFALIKHPMKILFMKPKKACLSILKGVFENTPYCEWIGPSIFNVWGYPKKTLLRSALSEERARIFLAAEKVYEKIK